MRCEGRRPSASCRFESEAQSVDVRERIDRLSPMNLGHCWSDGIPRILGAPVAYMAHEGRSDCAISSRLVTSRHIPPRTQDRACWDRSQT